MSLPPTFPFQEEGIARLAANRAYLLAWDMGLGKTRCVIADRITLQPNFPTLWACPGKARRTIADEFALWAPHLATTVVDEDWDGRTAPITITSYENLEKVAEFQPWRYLVLDESQYLKSWKAKRTQIVRTLRRSASHVRLLSGTPVANEPIDLYTQLDIMHPWRWGKYQDFAQYFCNTEANEYSPISKIWGNNPEHLAEFQEKLSHVCYRVTKAEVEHLLPPKPRVEAEYIRPGARKNLTLADALEGIQKKAKSRKVEAVLGLIEDHAVDEHFAVFTHLNDTVELLERACRERFPDHRLFIVPAVGRDALLKEARDYPGKKILISTLWKVAESVNTLTWPKLVVVAELPWQAAPLEQLLGRFWRLNSTHGVLVKLLVCEGTAEEAVSRVLQRKLQSGDELLGGSTEAKSSIAALMGDQEDELIRMRAAMKNRREVSDVET